MEQSYGTPPAGERPGEVTAIAVATLISGVSNITAAAGWTLAIVVGTFGIGLLCVPITILPGVLGIFEIIYGIRLLSTPANPVQPAQTLAILEIVGVLSGNLLSPIAGILALVFYNEPRVKAFFGGMNPGRL